jgi:hypothetical protein
MKTELFSPLSTSSQTSFTVEDVIAYLYDSLCNMRTYPLEDDFQVGYERAFNDVMYHLLESSPSAKPLHRGSTRPHGEPKLKERHTD